MKAGISLTELASRIEANSELKHDLITDTRAARIDIQDDDTPVLTIDDQGAYSILPTAHDQIATHTGVPARYYDRMLADPTARRLLAQNVNHWFTSQPKRRMVRTLGGDMRAFLSDRYRRIDHEDIAEVVLPVLLDTAGLTVVSTEITDRRLYIQATTDRATVEVRKGDVVQAGVIISNSEIGMGSVSIRPLMFRLICLNGAVMEDGRFRANHVGRRVEDTDELIAMWSDETKRADDNALLLKVRDTVRAALDEAMFSERMNRAKELAGAKITGDPIKSVEVLARKTGVGEGERSGILRSLIEGRDLSAWGLLNAVTHQAHSIESYDRAVEMEELGGQLLTMRPGDWKEVLEAV